MEKKSPHFVFLALLCSKGCHDVGPKALILEHYEQVKQTLSKFASEMNGENSMSKLNWAKTG